MAKDLENGGEQLAEGCHGHVGRIGFEQYRAEVVDKAHEVVAENFLSAQEIEGWQGEGKSPSLSQPN